MVLNKKSNAHFYVIIFTIKAKLSLQHFMKWKYKRSQEIELIILRKSLNRPFSYNLSCSRSKLDAMTSKSLSRCKSSALLYDAEAIVDLL
jgi:hypothetical protein